MPTKRKALAEMDGNAEVAVPPAKKTTKAASATKAATVKKFKYSDEAMVQESKALECIIVQWPSAASEEEEKEEEEEEDEDDEWESVDESDDENNSNTGKTNDSTGEAKDDVEKHKEDIQIDRTKKKVKAKKLNAEKSEDDAEDNKAENANNAENAKGNPKSHADLLKEMVNGVSDKGFSISELGMEKFAWLMNEQAKRDQDNYGMYVYNDFSGYGITEVMENLLADFNKVLFKKDVSALRKWAYIEGVATYLKLGDLFQWMMNDDSDGITEVIDMLGNMILTSFEVLSEHNLLCPSSPISNIAIISIIMIEFIDYGTGGNFADRIFWDAEVVRALDKAKIDIDSVLRKGVHVSKDQIEDMRERYTEKEEEGVYQKKAPSCEDDRPLGERAWARWNWKKEYALFRPNHRGGSQYNIAKWSKKERAQYEFK